MTIRRDKPNAPPPEYDQRWEYWFWEYVNTNLGTSTFGTFASLPFLAAAGDALGTSSTGTLTLALSTTGVAAGTYGGTAGVPRFDISAAGRVLGATNVAVEVQTPILLTKGAGTLQLSHNTSGVAAGTYGKADYSARVTIDEKGHIIAATEVAITGGTGTGVASADVNVTAPIIFSVGTGTGAVLQPFTIALSTTTVTPGTYGGTAGIPRFNIDAFGRVLSGTSVGTIASLVVGTGDPSNQTVLTVLGLGRFRRNDTSAEGGQINFDRALDGSSSWLIDVAGTGTAPVWRVINANVSPATVPFQLSAADRWSGAQGGFGLGTGGGRFTFDGTGAWVFNGGDRSAGPLLNMVGTGTAPNMYFRLNDGEYQVLKNGFGTYIMRLTQHGDFTVPGTGTAPGWHLTGTSTGAMSAWGTATGGFTRWGTGTFGLLQGTAAAITGTSTSGRFSGEGIVPTGCMLDYAGTASPPTGWLLCDGTAASRTTYADLFGVIGTVWGTGDGATTFNLPDTRRRVSVGFGGTAVGTLGTAVGNTGGAETVVLGTSEMPTHTHTQDSHNHTQDAHSHSADSDTMLKEGTEFGYDSGLFGFSTNGNGITATAATNQAATATNQNAGGGGAHNNIQPSYIVQKIIKT